MLQAAAADRYSLAPALEAGVVFVHVPKTGGTAVARALYGTDGIGHRTALEVRDEVGENAWRRAFSFAVVRDPVDRLASAFHYLAAGGSNRLDARFRDRVLEGYSTLDAFVAGWLTARSSRTQVHFRPQSDFVLDATGAVAVDRLVRYDDLEDGYEAVRRETGVGGPLRRANAGPPRPAVRLGRRAADVVRSVYASDVDLYRSL